jgi:hypothetical protein
MPMDRPYLVVSVRNLSCMLMLVALGSAGCRSTRSEVPPGKPYQTTGGGPPTVGFSNEPHPSTATGMAGLYGNKGPGALIGDGRGSSTPGEDVTYGTPAPGTPNLGAPTDNRYGPPGSAGTSATSPSGTAAVAGSLLKAIPPASRMVEKDPEAIPASGASPSGGAYP